MPAALQRAHCLKLSLTKKKTKQNPKRTRRVVTGLTLQFSPLNQQPPRPLRPRDAPGGRQPAARPSSPLKARRSGLASPPLPVARPGRFKPGSTPKEALQFLKHYRSYRPADFSAVIRRLPAPGTALKGHGEGQGLPSARRKAVTPAAPPSPQRWPRETATAAGAVPALRRTRKTEDGGCRGPLLGAGTRLRSPNRDAARRQGRPTCPITKRGRQPRSHAGTRRPAGRTTCFKQPLAVSSQDAPSKPPQPTAKARASDPGLRSQSESPAT